MVISSSPLPQKHSFDIVSSPLLSWKLALFSAAQPLNSPSPMQTTLFGISTRLSPLSAKHSFPSFSSAVGSWTATRVAQWQNALHSIRFSVEGSDTLSSALPSKTP